MQSQPIIGSYDKLPIDVLLKIFSYLSPEDVAAASAANRQSHRVVAMDAIAAQQFWRKKFALHFPKLMNEMINQHTTNWYVAFRDTYKKQYIYIPRRDRKLFSLVKEGDLEGVKQFFEKSKMKIDHDCMVYGISLIEMASINRQQSILDYLYNNFIIPYYTKNIEVHYSKRDDLGLSILHYAAACGQTKAVDSFLNENKIDINIISDRGLTPLFSAIEFGHIDVVNKLLAHPGINSNATMVERTTPLFFAAQFGHLDIVKVLLALHNGDINAAKTDGATPLFIAAEEGHIDIVNALLSQPDIKINAARTDGATPLCIAATHGHTNVVNSLLAHSDIDINAALTGDGATPLFIAAQNNHLDIVNALLSQPNIKINAARTEGATPLCIATANGHINVVNALLAKNAVIEEKALTYAIENNFHDIVKSMKIKLLENYIAKKSDPNVPEYKSFLLFFKRGISKTDRLAAAISELKKLKGEASEPLTVEQQKALVKHKLGRIVPK